MRVSFGSVRLTVRRPSLFALALLVLVTGCGIGPGRPGYRVTYTVESSSPNYLGTLRVTYVDGGETETITTPDPVKTWSVDVWVDEISSAYLSAEIPKDVVDRVQEITNYNFLGYPVRCRLAVNGVEVRTDQTENFCLTEFDFRDYEGETSQPFPATTHPPELWPRTTPTPTATAAPTTSAAPAEPRPETCRYATDVEITNIVKSSGGLLYFAGVTTTYPYSCLYRFSPLPVPGAPTIVGPFSGVTVIRYPTPFDDVDGDRLPGVPGAVRVSDQEVRGNVGGRGLSVTADLGSDFADSNAAEEVYELVRSRL